MKLRLSQVHVILVCCHAPVYIHIRLRLDDTMLLSVFVDHVVLSLHKYPPPRRTVL